MKKEDKYNLLFVLAFFAVIFVVMAALYILITNLLPLLQGF